MSDHEDLDDLPGDVAQLLAVTRAPAPLGDAALTRMERRLTLAAAMSVGAAAGASKGAAAGLGAKALAFLARRATIGVTALAIGMGLGAGLHAVAARSPAPTPAPPVVAVAPREAEPAPPVSSAPVAVAPAVTTGKGPTHELPEAPASVRPAAPKSDVAAERALVEMARTAAARGDFGGALAAAQKHEKSFPSGHLREERELVAVQALAGLGRTSEAAIRGEQFLRSYPKSMFAPAVKKLVGSAGGEP